MNILPIFAEHLYSFKYDNKHNHEYNKKLFEWQDFEFIFEKAVSNGIDDALVDQFFDEIFFDREFIRKKILEHCKTNKLCEIFVCLTNSSVKIEELERSKAKFFIQNRRKLSKLRLYALRVNNEKFIITGGAIKFSQKMDQHPDTKKELERFDKCKKFLISEEFNEEDLSTNIFES